MNEAILKMVFSSLGIDAAKVQQMLAEIGPVVKDERERLKRIEADCAALRLGMQALSEGIKANGTSERIAAGNHGGNGIAAD